MTSTLISLLAFLVSLILASQVGVQFIRRRKPHHLLWSVALVLFSIGTGCQFIGEVAGWTVNVYRLWYVSGAVLAAAYLGQGTLYLLMKKAKAHVVMVVLGVATVIAVVLVWTAPVRLGQALDGGVATGQGMPTSVRTLTPFFNIFGTIALVGGALQSMAYFLWNGRGDWRTLGTAAIAAGTIIVAAGGSLSRLGLTEALYPSELGGVVVIFLGFYFSNRPIETTALSSAVLRKRRHKIATWGVSSGALALLGLVMILPVLPWVMDIVKDAQHIYTETIPEENRGTYLLTNEGVMQLYTWKVDPPTFPSDAPTLSVRDLEGIVIIQKQFDVPENYRLYNIDSHQPIDWQLTEQEDSMHLRLVPSEDIGAGEYMLIVPTDSMFGGHDTHYFRLQ